MSNSELQALMMKQIISGRSKSDYGLGERKPLVTAGLCVDMSKLSEYVVGVLDERLSVAVEERSAH